MAVLVPSLALILSGCGADQVRLDKAAAMVGQAKARVHLPSFPAECRKHEPHAALIEQADALSALKRERTHVDIGNRRIDDCADFYDALRTKLY